MHNGKGERKKADGMCKKGVSYEEAINEAFTEIFLNLKVIEKDTELQRQMLHLERRRGSAPAAMLQRQTTTAFQPKVQTRRTRGESKSTSSIAEETTTAFGQLKVNLERRRGSSLSTIPSQFNQTEVRRKLPTAPNKRAVHRVNTNT